MQPKLFLEWPETHENRQVGLVVSHETKNIFHLSLGVNWELSTSIEAAQSGDVDSNESDR